MINAASLPPVPSACGVWHVLPTESKAKQNRPSFCNYHHGSHAAAPQIRFTARNYVLNLLAVGMENLVCNGKGALYFGRVEFERDLWRSALSLRGQMASTLFPSTRLHPGSLRPAAERLFLESKFPNPVPATVCGLGKVSLTFVRFTFMPLRRFIEVGQGNFQSFGHPH
jgi:hypothetical protein